MKRINGNILVVVAHPDDEVLGCGGTISRLTNEGVDVYIAILGEGITSRYDRRDQADKEELEALKEKSARVADALGAKGVFHFALPDNRFDTLALLDIIKPIEELIDRLQPEKVFTHHGGDLNIDHNLTFRAVLTATRPLHSCPVKELYTFEVPSSTEWSFGKIDHAFAPNVFFDVSSFLDTKIRALELYDGEIRAFPNPRSSRLIRSMAEKWGSAVALEAAEAFHLIRSIR